MSALPKHIEAVIPSVEEIASAVASILARRLNDKDLLKLLQVTFLTREEVAQLLRVSPKTVSAWMADNKIPVRYANSEPRFLLAEIIAWTLPEDDPHACYRLAAASGIKLAGDRLAASEEEKNAGISKKVSKM